MPRRPVPGDVDPPGKPDRIVALGVGDEAREGCDAARAADQPAVQPDGEHLGAAGFALRVEGVEASLR